MFTGQLVCPPACVCVCVCACVCVRMYVHNVVVLAPLWSCQEVSESLGVLCTAEVKHRSVSVTQLAESLSALAIKEMN